MPIKVPFGTLSKKGFSRGGKAQRGTVSHDVVNDWLQQDSDLAPNIVSQVENIKDNTTSNNVVIPITYSELVSAATSAENPLSPAETAIALGLAVGVDPADPRLRQVSSDTAHTIPNYCLCRVCRAHAVPTAHTAVSDNDGDDDESEPKDDASKGQDGESNGHNRDSVLSGSGTQAPEEKGDSGHKGGSTNSRRITRGGNTEQSIDESDSFKECTVAGANSRCESKISSKKEAKHGERTKPLSKKKINGEDGFMTALQRVSKHRDTSPDHKSRRRIFSALRRLPVTNGQHVPSNDVSQSARKSSCKDSAKILKFLNEDTISPKKSLSEVKKQLKTWGVDEKDAVHAMETIMTHVPVLSKQDIMFSEEAMAAAQAYSAKIFQEWLSYKTETTLRDIHTSFERCIDDICDDKKQLLLRSQTFECDKMKDGELMCNHSRACEIVAEETRERLLGFGILLVDLLQSFATTYAMASAPLGGQSWADADFSLSKDRKLYREQAKIHIDEVMESIETMENKANNWSYRGNWASHWVFSDEKYPKTCKGLITGHCGLYPPVYE